MKNIFEKNSKNDVLSDEVKELLKEKIHTCTNYVSAKDLFGDMKCDEDFKDDEETSE